MQDKSRTLSWPVGQTHLLTAALMCLSSINTTTWHSWFSSKTKANSTEVLAMRIFLHCFIFSEPSWWHVFVPLQIGHQNGEADKHAALCALVQCREPRPNERDVLMAFHLFMHGKWRGSVTFWSRWQNKEATLGEWLYLWFGGDRWRYQEGGRLTHWWQFKVLNDVMYGNALQHSL